MVAYLCRWKRRSKSIDRLSGFFDDNLHSHVDRNDGDLLVGERCDRSTLPDEEKGRQRSLEDIHVREIMIGSDTFPFLCFRCPLMF